MANGIKNNDKPKSDNLVLALKFSILLVIVILPVSFMILDSSKLLLPNQFGYQNAGFKTANKADNPGAEFNLQISIPAPQLGDKNSVSPEKLNSLFSNLKK